MKRYTSTARKQGRWWVVQCDQEPGALSQVARLDQAADHQREAISFVTDTPAQQIDVDVMPIIDDEVTSVLSRAAAERARSEELARSASDGFRTAARVLAADGYSLRDVGAILGVSFQRAGQLVND